MMNLLGVLLDVVNASRSSLCRARAWFIWSLLMSAELKR